MGVFVRRSSSVSQLSPNLLSRFLSNFSSGFPMGHTPRLFLNFWNKKYIFNFCFRFCVNHVNMGPYGSQNLQTPIPPLNQFSIFSNCLCIFFWVVLIKVLKLDFWNLEFVIFQDFFFALTWDPMGAETTKHYSSLKSLWNYFKLFLNILLSGPHKSTVLDFWNLELMICNGCFRNFKVHHCTL